MKHAMTLVLGTIIGFIVAGIATGKNDTTMQAKKNYKTAQLNEITPVACPCGDSRRAFSGPDNPVATLHLTTIKADSQVHYHKKLTETYLILEGSGHMELDGEKVAVKPMSAILIKPGCRHRAVGKLKIAIFVFPAFDPKDEWFD